MISVVFSILANDSIKDLLGSSLHGILPVATCLGFQTFGASHSSCCHAASSPSTVHPWHVFGWPAAPSHQGGASSRKSPMLTLSNHSLTSKTTLKIALVCCYYWLTCCPNLSCWFSLLPLNLLVLSTHYLVCFILRALWGRDGVHLLEQWAPGRGTPKCWWPECHNKSK